MSEAMLTAFRHDAHKFTGESHGDAREEFAGVPVNQSVPEGADGDAAALSRPQQKQEQTVPTHDDHYRLSLLTGETAYDPGDDGETAHERWLASDTAAAFKLETVDHGQVVKYLGDRSVETAKNGLQRIGSHSRYGFGELRVKPLPEQYQESEKKD